MSTNDSPTPGPDESKPDAGPLSSGEISRRVRRRQKASAPLSHATLREQIVAIMDEHTRQTVAARALAGDPNPTDDDPLEYVYEIAQHYDQREERPNYLAQLADELTLDDVRALRLAGEAAKAVTPLVVLEESSRGKGVPQIAGEVGLTESRVYAILREQRAADPDGVTRWDAYWTLERHENDAWHEITAQGRKDKARPKMLARYLLVREQDYQPSGARLRVRVWKAGTNEFEPPLAEISTDDL